MGEIVDELDAEAMLLEGDDGGSDGTGQKTVIFPTEDGPSSPDSRGRPFATEVRPVRSLICSPPGE